MTTTTTCMTFKSYFYKFHLPNENVLFKFLRKLVAFTFSIFWEFKNKLQTQGCFLLLPNETLLLA